MAPGKVGIVGATGETGKSIINGLLEAKQFDIVALTRPASMSKPANAALKDRGVEIRPLDLKASQDEIVVGLKDIEILISAIGPREQLEQIPLATAAKTAGVKRFLPCGAITIIPAGGLHWIRDQKEEVYNHVKRLYLPYTIVDVGWWYQIAFPALPSGKIDYAVAIKGQNIPGDGNVPSGLTDLRDIGRYFAKIIVDERTVNKYVFVYNEVWTPNQVYDLLEKLSGEKLPRKFNSLETLQARVKDADEKLKTEPQNFGLSLQQVESQYQISWGIRGDNTPEHAKYLGYLDGKELYPDFKPRSLEGFLKDVLDGKMEPIYEHLRALVEELNKGQEGH